MTDLVGTCPKTFWEEWLAEGDMPGTPETGEEWGWYTLSPMKKFIYPGNRFYVVAHGKLRGWSTVTRISDGAIFRMGNAVACTIDEPIPGFQGLRRRWWRRDMENHFINWKIP